MVSNVKQTDISDCGVACVKSILHHYNIEVGLSELKLFNPLKVGFYSFADLSLLFEKFNIEAIGYTSDFKSLNKLRSPFIAHVRIKGLFPHFVVVKSINGNNVCCMNPSTGGTEVFNKSNFLRIWSGKILIPSTLEGYKKIPESYNISAVVSFIVNKRASIVSVLIAVVIYLIAKVFI